MDGSVSLSLDAEDATVDAASDTLSWSVASQPWEDGDTLMLRIRRGPNRPPVFDTSTYAFTVREDAPAWRVIGYVSASDPDARDSPLVLHHRRQRGRPVPARSQQRRASGLEGAGL